MLARAVSRSRAAGPSKRPRAPARPSRGALRSVPQQIRDLRIELVPVAKLVPYARNARLHSEAQVAQIAAAIQEFGWTNPVITNARGGILAGHGRVLAAERLGYEVVPCIRRSNLTRAQERAYVLADNRLAELAAWDPELLGLELGELRAEGFNLELAGFSPDDVDRWIAQAGATTSGRTDPDDAPPLPEVAVSRLGDVWLLGEHRVACGDCTSRDAVSALLERARGRKARQPRLMVTDPPYGVEYDPAWRERSGLAKAGGKMAKGKLRNDDRADWREAWALFPGDVAYVWHAGNKAHVVAASLEAMKFQVRAQIVWVKTRFVISRGAYHGQHEPAFYAVREGADDHWQNVAPPEPSPEDVAERFDLDHANVLYAVREGATAAWAGGRKQSTVWTIEHLRNDSGHPTQKPLEAMRRPIENNSAPGDGVYDPFLGSGTTLIAAEVTGRRCFAFDLDPRYVDVAVRRWQDFTGREAVLESGEQPFAAVKEARS